MRHLSAHRHHSRRLLTTILGAAALLAPLAHAATVQFSSASLQANEADGTATITIERTGDASNAASVGIVFTHGTATSTDFTLSTQSVSWAAGDASPRTIDVTLAADGTGEGSETAYFALTNVVGDTLGTTTELQLQILETNGVGGNLPTPLRTILDTLEDICSGPVSGELASGCAEYNALSDEDKQIAANTMLPRQVAAQITDAAQSQYGVSQAIRQRMQTVRGGGGSNSFAGLTLMMDGELVSAQSLVDEWAQQNLGGNPGGNAGAELLDDRFGVFVSGQIQVADKDSTENELGYEADSQQITAGMDYRASDKLFYGGALSYSTSNADYNDNGGEQDSDILIVNAFGNYYFTDNWYADALVSYGSSSFDSERVIRLGSNRYTASSDTDGNQWGLAVTGGYDRALRAWQFGGYTRVEYNRFDIDGYEEEGGGGFALAIGQRDAKSMQTAFGGSVSYVKSVSYGIWVPKFSAEWVHEFEDDTRELSASFVNAPLAGTIILPTGEVDSDFFNVGWSIAGTFAGGRSAWLRYEAQLGRDDYIAELVELGARFPF